MDLAWGIFKQEKWGQVVSDTIPPENLESLDKTNVNKEVWLKISHELKVLILVSKTPRFNFKFNLHHK